MQQIVPVVIGANLLAKVGSGRVPWERATVQVVPMNASTVYMWLGRDDIVQGGQAAADVASAEPTWDTACCFAAGPSPKIRIEGGSGPITLYAPGGTGLDCFLVFEEYRDDARCCCGQPH